MPAFAVTIGGTSPVQEVGVSPDSLNIHQVLKQRSTCEFRVPDTAAAIGISEGREVVVYDDLGARIFGGTIDEATWRVQSGAGRTERFWEVRCVDFNQLADRRSAGEYTWTDTAIGQIVRDIVNQSMDGDEFFLDEVQDGPIIPLFQTFYGSCAEAFDELCKIAAGLVSSPVTGLEGLAWQWFIDYDRHFHFFAPGSVTPIVEIVGDDPDDLFTAEPTLATIDLTADDFRADTLRMRVSREDYANKVVALFNGEVANAQDNDEIALRAAAEGGSGVYEKVFKLDDRTVISGLQEYADAQLNRLKRMSKVLTGQTRREDLRVGQIITVTVPGYGDYAAPDSATQYLIRSITIRDERATVLWREIEAIAGPVTRDYVEWFRELRGGSVSGSSAAGLLSEDFNNVVDCLKGTTGSMDAGGNTLTRGGQDPLFEQHLVGKPIAIYGAGPTVYAKDSVAGSPTALAAGDILVTTVVAVADDGLTLTTADNATATVTLAQWASGTDNTPAFNAAIARQRAAGGGTLTFKNAGDSFFASHGWTGVFGDKYIDRVDYDNFHVDQGPATIVIGCPMGLCEMNQSVFNQWTLVESGPARADLIQPVAKGDLLLYVNPAQTVDGFGNPLFNRGDYILIFTGYIGTIYFGFNLPDAQICEVVFCDTTLGIIILAEPTLKPFVQESYPAWTGGTSPPSGNAPFGIINVTDILIHNFRWTNLNVDSFFFANLFEGGQCEGMFFEGGQLKLRETWHAMNYVRGGVTNNVNGFIDNLASPRLPFSYYFTCAVGTSHVTFKDSKLTSTGVTFLHLHEGAAGCTMQNVYLGSFTGNPNTYGIQPVSIRGRSYGLKMIDCDFTGYDSLSVIYIENSCTDGGLILNCTINGRAAALTPIDIECHGENWRIDCRNIEQSRIYQKSTNIGRFVNRFEDTQQASIEAVAGLLSAHGGIGYQGNILTGSDNLKAGSGPWTNNTGVTVTGNAGDLADPIGTFTSTKAVLGLTTATEIGTSAPTPDPGSVLRGVGSTAINDGRTFILSLYAYCTTESQMDIRFSSFNGSTLIDPLNDKTERFAMCPDWRRLDMEMAFVAGAGYANILINLCSGVNGIGEGSTMYFWGVTLQEKSQYKPLITHTVNVGVAVPYALIMRHIPGKLQIGAIADDGVSAVQFQGDTRIVGKVTSTSLVTNGWNMNVPSVIAYGAHSTDGGATWIADATTAILVQILGSQFVVWQNSGLTPTVAFTPTLRFSLVGASAVLSGNPITLTGYAGPAPLKLNVSKEIISAAITLDTGSTDITGKLPLANGGLDATTAAGGRITLDVYSKADVDGMVAAIYAAMATKGNSTSTNSGHSHTQT